MSLIELTDKQKKFVDEYLCDLNATQAAIRAGYSKKTAGSVGNENLKKPEIQIYLKERQMERQKRTEVTQDMIVQHLAKVAFLEFDSEPIVEGIAKTSDKIRALELLGKHSGMFTDKIQMSGEMSVNNPYAGITTDELKKLISDK